MKRVITVHNHFGRKRKANDHWYVAKRNRGWELLEGAGTNGGQWALRGPDKRVSKFRSRAEAEEAFGIEAEDKARDSNPDDPRRLKRYFNKIGVNDPIQEAYYRGQQAGESGKGSNPYPPGKRREEWERGYKVGKTARASDSTKDANSWTVTWKPKGGATQIKKFISKIDASEFYEKQHIQLHRTIAAVMLESDNGGVIKSDGSFTSDSRTHKSKR